MMDKGAADPLQGGLLEVQLIVELPEMVNKIDFRSTPHATTIGGHPITLP